MPALTIEVEQGTLDAIRAAGAEDALRADSVVLVEIVKWSLQSISGDIGDLASGRDDPEGLRSSIETLTGQMQRLGIAAANLGVAS